MRELMTGLMCGMLLAGSYRQGTSPSQGQAASATQAASSHGASAPVVISVVNPQYTDEARADKISGIVLVHLEVSESGLPVNVRVVRGIGHGLDDKAVEAVKQYRFQPAMKNGQAVKTELNIQVNFQVY